MPIKIPAEDWSALFQGKTHMIAGKIPVPLEPVGIKTMQKISGRAVEILSALEANGITFENFTDRDNIAVALPVIFEAVPEVLADFADMDANDLKRLPIEHVMALALDVIEVNYASLDYLQKNLQSLATVLIVAKNMALGISSKS